MLFLEYDDKVREFQSTHLREVRCAQIEGGFFERIISIHAPT